MSTLLPPFELRFTFLESDQIDRMPLLARRLIEMSNGGGIRFGPRWPELEPKPGEFNLATVDAGVGAINDAGGHVYLDLIDTPAHALCYVDADGKWSHQWEGYRTWFPKDAGQIIPTCWKRANGVFSPEYDPTISAECASPPRENPDAVRSVAAALAKHCGTSVRSWGKGNECDDARFYPLFASTWMKNDGDWSAATNLTYVDSWRPFSGGLRSVLPDAIVEGTESQTYGTLAYTLWTEKQNRDRTFDVITTHGYAGAGKSFPDDAIARITTKDGGLFQYLSDYGVRDDRPLGIGEVAREDGDDPYSVLEYIAVMRSLGFSFVTLMRLEDFFKPGTFADGKYEPNDLYEQVRKLMQRITSRHRAARS